MRMDLVLIFLGMTAVTYLTRSLFTVMVARVRTGPFTESVLSTIPLATLTALITPGLLNPGGNGVVILANPFLLAGVYILVFSFLTRNLLLSVLTGIGLFMLLSQFLPL